MTTLTTALARSKTPIKSPKLPSPGRWGATGWPMRASARRCFYPPSLPCRWLRAADQEDDDDDEGAGGEEGDEEELGLTRSIHF